MLLIGGDHHSHTNLRLQDIGELKKIKDEDAYKSNRESARRVLELDELWEEDDENREGRETEETQEREREREVVTESYL